MSVSPSPILPSDSSSVNNNDFKADLKLAAGPTIKNLISISNGSPLKKKLFLDPQTQETVTMTGAQGNLIPGHLYIPKGRLPAPAILLLHGSTPVGKQMGLYRLLGYRLAEQGYVVLTIDQRGHGQAPRPKVVKSPQDLDFSADAMLALAYLKERSEVNSDEVYLLGHSFGGDVAITSGARGIEVEKILAFGPGRRYKTRVQDELPYFCRRFSRYMKLNEIISPDLFLKTIGAQLLEEQAEAYKSAGHTPIMLIDGGYESQADREFLATLVGELAESVQYKSIPKADHYANVAFFGRLIVYDEPVLERFLSEITAWFR